MIKKILKIIIYVFPALFGLLVALNIIFPKEVYLFDQETEVNQFIFASNNSFSAAVYNDFDKIILDFEIEDKNSDLANKKVIVKKGYPAAFYPIMRYKDGFSPNYKIKSFNDKFYLVKKNKKYLIPTQKILKSYGQREILKMSQEEYNKLELAKNLAGFMDGTLIKFSDSAFVIANGKRILITDPLSFESLGYDWDSLVEATESEARIHSKGPEPLTLKSAHPNGTILLNKINNHYYLVKDLKLIEFDQAAYQKYFSRITPIKFNNNKEEITENGETKIVYQKSAERTCELDKYLNCSFKLDDFFKSQTGNAYHFQLPENLKIKEAKITFTRKFSFDNLKMTLSKYR
jgi:hypothetical protein